MNDKDTMQEKYEDAMFSLFLERVAEARGKQAYEENEALKADPAFAVPEDLEKRCVDLIHKKLKKQSAGKTRRVIKMSLYRAAAVACVALVIFITAFAASPRLQTSAINFLIREFDGYTTFSFTDHVTVSSAPKVTAPWLPEGFLLTAQEQMPSHTSLIYENNSGLFVRIYVSDTQSTITIDNEKANPTNITINDFSALYSDDGRIKTVIWNIDTLNLTVYITGAGISESEILQIAENLHVAF